MVIMFFAMVINNSEDDRYIEIHFELYTHGQEQIGDLSISITDDLSYNELKQAVEDIVNMYLFESHK